MDINMRPRRDKMRNCPKCKESEETIENLRLCHNDWYNIEKMLINRNAIFVKLDKELNYLMKRGK